MFNDKQAHCTQIQFPTYLNPLFQRCISRNFPLQASSGMSFLFMILRWSSCVEIWGSWEISQPRFHCASFFFFPAPCLMHHVSPHPMQRKPGVLTTGSPGKSPLLLYFKTGCQVDKDLDFEAWQPGLKFQLCCFPAVWPWASFLTSLMANFFLFQRGWW